MKARKFLCVLLAVLLIMPMIPTLSLDASASTLYQNDFNSDRSDWSGDTTTAASSTLYQNDFDTQSTDWSGTVWYRKGGTGGFANRQVFGCDGGTSVSSITQLGTYSQSQYLFTDFSAKYEMQLNTTPSATYDGVSLFFRAGADFNNAYRLAIGRGFARISWYAAGGTSAIIQENTSISLSLSQVYSVRLIVKGNRFTAFIDEKKVLDCTDASSRYSSGRFCISSWESAAEIDNFVVSSLRYQNDFTTSDAGFILSNYTVGTGTGSFAGQNVYKNTGGASVSERAILGNYTENEYLYGSAYANFDFKINSIINTTYDGLTFYFRAQADYNYSYRLRIYTNKVIISWNTTSTSTTIAENTNISLSTNTVYNISLATDGNRFKAYIDGVKVLDCVDLDNRYTSGRFCFSAWEMATEIDNLFTAENPVMLEDSMFLKGGTGEFAGKRVFGTAETNSKLAASTLGASDQSQFLFGDFSAKYDMQLNSTPSSSSDYVALGFRGGSDIKNMYKLLIGRGFVKINWYASDGTSGTVGENTSISLNLLEVYSVRLIAQGNRFTVFIDEKKVLDCTDGSSLYSSGRFQFSVWEAAAEIDNFLVSTSRYQNDFASADTGFINSTYTVGTGTGGFAGQNVYKNTGGASVSQGARLGNYTENQYLYTDGFANFDLKINSVINTTYDCFSLYFRAQADYNYTYRLKIFTNKIAISWNTTTINETIAENTNVSFSTGTIYNISLAMDGNRFIAYVDGVKVLDCFDPNNRYTSGRFCISSWEMATEFDNLFTAENPVIPDDSVVQVDHVADQAVPTTAIYVATNGNNTTGDGTITKPYLTFEKARDVIAAMKSGSGLPAGGVVVYIRGGTYTRTSTFSLSSTSSGDPGKPIVYMAYPGETVIVSGAKTLTKTNFATVTDSTILNKIIDTGARSQLKEINLTSEGVTDLGTITRRGYSFNQGSGAVQPELYIGDSKMTLARWPNSGKLVYDTVVSVGTPPTSSTDGGDGPLLRFSTAVSRFSSWNDKTNVWIDGILSRDWAWTYNKIESISADNKDVKLEYGDAGGDANTWCLTRGFHFENILEEIDMPGEYFIDRATGKLYLYPPANFNDASVTAKLSMTNANLVQMNTVSNVTLRSITFEYGRQSAIYSTKYYTSPDNESSEQNILLDRLDIRGFSGNGIILSGKNNTITNCHIHNIGGTGVLLTGGQFSTLTPSNTLVQNNYIHDVGEVVKVYKPAISINGVGITLSHNIVKNTPHDAFEIRGNDHIVESNEFYNCVMLFRDIGVIYTNQGANPSKRGIKIHNNYFHNFDNGSLGEADHSDTWAIYLDNGTTGVDIRNNVIADSKTGGIFYHGGGYNKAEGNVLVNLGVPFRYSYLYLASWAYSNGLIKSLADSWTTQRTDLTDYSTKYFFKPEYSALGKYSGLLDFLQLDPVVDKMKVTSLPSYTTAEKESLWLSQIQDTYKNNLVYNNASNPLSASVLTTGVYTGAVIEDNGGKADVLQASGNTLLSSNPGFVNAAVKNYQLQSGVHSSVDFANMGVLDMSKIPGTSGSLNPTSFNTLYPRNGMTGVTRTGNPARVISADNVKSDAGVFLRWERTLGCDKYTIEIATNSTFTQNKQTFTSYMNYATVGTLSANTTYYWRVTASSLARGNTATSSNSDGVRSFTTGS